MKLAMDLCWRVKPRYSNLAQIQVETNRTKPIGLAPQVFLSMSVCHYTFLVCEKSEKGWVSQVAVG